MLHTQERSRQIDIDHSLPVLEIAVASLLERDDLSAGDEARNLAKCCRREAKKPSDLRLVKHIATSSDRNTVSGDDFLTYAPSAMFFYIRDSYASALSRNRQCTSSANTRGAARNNGY